VVAGAAGTALGLTALAWLARACYQAGQAQGTRSPSTAGETLHTAQFLLPWDHQIADARRLNALRTGRWDEATEAARRAIRLAPYRPASFLFMGNIWRTRGGHEYLVQAAQWYHLGLNNVPNDLQLLFAYAGVREEMGDRAEAVTAYRRIADLEDSPVGQVRALNEVLDYRFARARMALAQAEPDPEAASKHRTRAACLLARRRLLFERGPGGYRAVGDWDPRMPANEEQLRYEERTLWQRLAQEYRERRENRLAELAERQAEESVGSLEHLERINRQFLGLPAS
jgi:tetratricopeptide (TPR) repeat protein